jgi:hypothetical protein
VDTLLLRWIDEIHFNLLVDRSTPVLRDRSQPVLRDRSQPVLRVVYDAARTSAR